MIRALFMPVSEAEELAQEREKVARRKPHLVIADKRPDPTMFSWFSVEEMVERERRS